MLSRNKVVSKQFSEMSGKDEPAASPAIDRAAIIKALLYSGLNIFSATGRIRLASQSLIEGAIFSSCAPCITAIVFANKAVFAVYGFKFVCALTLIHTVRQMIKLVTTLRLTVPASLECHLGRNDDPQQSRLLHTQETYCPPADASSNGFRRIGRPQVRSLPCI